MIRMLRTLPGSPNGKVVNTYLEGREYGPDTDPPTSPDLERLWIGEGFAVPVLPLPFPLDIRQAGPAETPERRPAEKKGQYAADPSPGQG